MRVLFYGALSQNSKVDSTMTLGLGFQQHSSLLPSLDTDAPLKRQCSRLGGLPQLVPVDP